MSINEQHHKPTPILFTIRERARLLYLCLDPSHLSFFNDGSIGKMNHLYRVFHIVAPDDLPGWDRQMLNSCLFNSIPKPC